MSKFDLLYFIFAMLATIGMIGIGIAFAQQSVPLFLSFFGLSVGSVAAGFIRKRLRKQRQQFN